VKIFGVNLLKKKKRKRMKGGGIKLQSQRASNRWGNSGRMVTTAVRLLSGEIPTSMRRDPESRTHRRGKEANGKNHGSLNTKREEPEETDGAGRFNSLGMLIKQGEMNLAKST